jgi:hypothetical protein
MSEFSLLLSLDLPPRTTATRRKPPPVSMHLNENPYEAARGSAPTWTKVQ